MKAGLLLSLSVFFASASNFNGFDRLSGVTAYYDPMATQLVCHGQCSSSGIRQMKIFLRGLNVQHGLCS